MQKNKKKGKIKQTNKKKRRKPYLSPRAKAQPAQPASSPCRLPPRAPKLLGGMPPSCLSTSTTPRSPPALPGSSSRSWRHPAHARATLSPLPPLFVLPAKNSGDPRNPSRHDRAPTQRQQPSSRTTVSRRIAEVDFVISPSQSSSSPSESDASFTEDSPDPQDAVVEFTGHRASPATPPPQIDSG